MEGSMVRLEQWQIQRWIERIPVHIKELIRLEGGMNIRKEGAGVARLKTIWQAIRQSVVAEVAAEVVAAAAAIVAAVKLIQIRSQSCHSRLHTMLVYSVFYHVT